MSEQQVSALLAAITAQTLALSEQTAAIQRLAESNEVLVAALYQDDFEDPAAAPTYLNGKPRG